MIVKKEKKKKLCSYQRFRYIHVWSTLHHERKYLCRYCLQAFRTAEILKCHFKHCFKINGKESVKMSKKSEYIKFKNYEKKIIIIKWPFMIYTSFKSILVF